MAALTLLSVSVRPSRRQGSQPLKYEYNGTSSKQRQPSGMSGGETNGKTMPARPSTPHASASRRARHNIERSICKRPHASATLVGRRVQIPQRFFPDEVVDDGDGFCFGGTVVSCRAREAIISFDYTGEREAWPLALVTTWCEPDISPLCDHLAGMLQATATV